MNRRTVLAAPAAIATSTALPAVALGATIPTDLDYDAIRERIALVCETFSKSTFGFPDPMPAGEARAAMAMTDAEIDELGALARFAHRWGVSLDWLIKGDVGSLLHDGRQLREREHAERAAKTAADNDPAVAAYRALREADDACQVVVDTGVDPSDELQDARSQALRTLADATATTVEGLEAQIRASFDVFAELRYDGDPTNPDDYEFLNGWEDELDGRMLRSMMAGAAGLVARETGQPVSYTAPPGKTGDAFKFTDIGQFKSEFAKLDEVTKKGVLRYMEPLLKGDVAGAEAAYRSWTAEVGRPVNEKTIALFRKA
ncbi:MAG: hypothetical protein AAFT19_04275 [Pseudomonadota bacterium]